MHNDVPSRVLPNNINNIILPQREKIENFAREKFLLGGGYLRSDFDHSDLLQS